MANADMNRMMDNARIRLPGATDGTIQLELFSCLNEFFQSSNIWTEDVPFQVFQTSLNFYENPEAFTYEVTPTMGVINRLMYMLDTQGNPRGGSMATPGVIILDYSPETDTTYTATVGLTVTDPTTRDGYPEFPAWILNKYGNDILDGVLARMMSQPAKPYSNAQLALVHAKNFRGAISQAKVEAQHKNVYRGQSWRFPRTFARRRIR
jgi:hypothetical protein